MPEYPRIYRGLNCGYKYAEIQILSDQYASIGVDVRDGGLTVWSLGQRVGNTPVSAKKIRKFARALLALVDEVDPPAPKFEYYRAEPTFGDFIFYRIDDSTVEAFEGGTWSTGNTSLNTPEGMFDLWGDKLTKIRRRDLPEETR